jgi:hypothetical protein
MKTLCALILALTFANPALAELPFKKKQQAFTTRRPGEVAETLRNGNPVQRNDLTLELGIFAPGAATKTNSPCVDFSHIEERLVTLRAESENSVLVAESSACDSTYLVVFEKAPQSEWRHLQTVRLASRTQRPVISFVELIQPGVSEIMVRHETTLDTGGALQQDFVILKIVHDRVEVVLDAAERSEITLANRVPGETDILETQTSTFDLLKAPAGSPATYRLLEKQVITDNKITITRYKLWTWDPELERFHSAPFDGGDVRPAPAPARKPAPPPAKPSPK